MLDEELIIRRLATIKYLYNIGVQQSMQVDIIAGFSILSFHDCTEMFLLLVAENKEIDSKSISFMEFWNKCPELTLKESMRALKERRVSIKHKGQFPSKSDIDISRITITNFMEENCPIQFGVNFNEISISNLISYEDIRRLIDKAELLYNEANLYESLKNSKIAFIDLLYIYEESKRNPSSFNSMLNIGEKIDDQYKKLIGSDYNSGAKWFEEITRTTNKIREILKITALGVDYKKYILFEAVTPVVEIWYKDGKRTYQSLPKELHEKNHQLRGTDCRFCIDFVIDSALKLQEFDYNLNRIFNHR